MRRTINLISKVFSVLMLFMCFAATGCYDDSAIQEQLTDHENRLQELERLTAQQNTNIASLQTIVNALQEKDYVTSIAPIMEGDKVVGYTIFFSKGGAVTIYNSNDVYVPVIGVKLDADGQWYWTIDGNWMTDADGNKVSASGEQGGVAPQLKIVDGYWYVSFDGGKTWEAEAIGQVSDGPGGAMFAEVSYDDCYLYITMADGEKITIPRTSSGQVDDGQVGPIRFEITKITDSKVTFTGVVTEDTVIPYIADMAVYYKDASDAFSIVSANVVSTAEISPDNTVSITVSDLSPGTAYNYCLHVKSRGIEFFSDVKEFVTDSTVFVENEAWTVEYLGASELDGHSYDHVVSITSTDDNYYFIDYISEDYFNELGAADAARASYNALLEIIDIFSMLGLELDVMDVSYNTSTKEPYNIEPGEWRFMAIGVTAEGELSGLYAVSDLVSIVEPEPTEGYSSWLGDWTFTGSNGVVQEVTFSKDVVNETYIMTGYEGEGAEGLEVIVTWNEEEQSWTIDNQNLGTYSVASGEYGDIWFFGVDSEESFHNISGLPICKGSMAEDGTLIATAITETWEENGLAVTFTADRMGFAIDIEDDWYYITSTYMDVGLPTFPITITPSAPATRAYSVEESMMSRRIFMPSPYKYNTFGAIK